MYSSRISDLTNELNSALKLSKELEFKLKDEVSGHNETKANLTSAIKEVEGLKSMFNEKLNAKEKEYMQKEKEMSTKFKKDMEALLSSHYKETEELKAQFDNAISLQNQKYSQLLTKYDTK